MTEDPDRNGPLLVFVHIPKTAGTTLRAILSMSVPGTRTRALANVFKGGGGVSKTLIGRLKKDNAPDMTGVELMRGHFPLGIREYLPKDRELRCFTFLREPVERTLSHYFAVREHGRSYGLPPLPPDASLEYALESGYIHDNLQTRMLSGLAEPFGEVTEEMLEQAKKNLRELAFVGLTEHFDESLVLAKERLGLDTVLYRSNVRVNAGRPRGNEVSEELVEAAKRCNSYDIELYRYALELFDSAPERGELEFEVEVAALRAAKGEGEIKVEAPVPANFAGDEKAWRMLVHAEAKSERLKSARKRHRIPHVPATVQHEVRESELKAARTRSRKLERQVEQLRAVSTRAEKLEEEVENLKGARTRAKKLEQEVERLEAETSSRTNELEQQVEQLKSEISSKTKELEEAVERLAIARSKRKKLEHKVKRLRTSPTGQ